MAKLFVIPGHGAGDSGAVGNGYQEQERVRALATKIKQYGGDNVMLADFNRNYYADGGINRLTISKEYKIVELHMDSAAASARGGHVIIQKGIGGADQWDKALADLMGSMFPGRANKLVERSDLANPARAAAKGYNYRLVENGFISNKQDVEIFNTRMDELAKKYCEIFGVLAKAPDAWTAQLYQTNNSNAQRFKIAWDDKKEWFQLTCASDGRNLDVSGAGAASGTKVQVYTPNKSNAQWWKAVPVADSYAPLYSTPVYLVPKCAPNMVLDVSGSKDADGTGLQLYAPHGGLNQQWNMLDLGGGVVTLVTNLGTHRALDVKGGGK